MGEAKYHFYFQIMISQSSKTALAFQCFTKKMLSFSFLYFLNSCLKTSQSESRLGAHALAQTTLRSCSDLDKSAVNHAVSWPFTLTF